MLILFPFHLPLLTLPILGRRFYSHAVKYLLTVSTTKMRYRIMALQCIFICTLRGVIFQTIVQNHDGVECSFLWSDDIPCAIIVSKSLFVTQERKQQLSMNELFMCESKWLIIIWL